MNAATAPPRWALNTFSLKVQVPRMIRAILPVREPAGYGLASPASEHPSDLLLAAVLTVSAGTYTAGPTVVVICGPKAAPANVIPTRFAGTGAGSVTVMNPGTIVVFFETAPTLITLSEIATEPTVSVSGPAFPFENTTVTPASTASSAACTIGSGHASVFWYVEPQEFEITSAPSLTASSNASTSSTVYALPVWKSSGLWLG